MIKTPIQTTDMTAADYALQFPEITVQLNWQRFAREGWPVHRHVVTDREELLGYHTFFRQSLGRIMPHFLHWLAVRQMRVREVLGKLHRIPAVHRERITHFARQWATKRNPIRFQLPTYRLGGDQHFVVDGNHRACAIALSGRPFRLELYSIVGPIDRDALVDIVQCR